MQKLIVAAATIAFGTMLASASVLADDLRGGPKQVGSQCFKYSPSNERDGRFGAWSGCAEPASAAVASATQRRTTRRPASR